MMACRTYNILFLCSGNRARSIVSGRAEGAGQQVESPE